MSSSRDIERYAGLFASRTKVMKSSAMRDLMAVTARPEVISLAGGLPDTSTFPPETFAAVAQRIATESCARALQYGPTEGVGETKACIAEVMAAEGMAVDGDDLIVTTGGQQVLDLVTKTLIDLLDETLERLEREGRRPKFVYTVPSFQNPAGVTMSLERRRQLVEIARRRELLVLEDNPYGLLRYEGSPEPTLRSLDGGLYVMYLGTFSKILSPGIRLGWVAAPPPVLEKINTGKQGADLCTSTLSQLMVEAYFAESRWRDYVDQLAEVYRARRDTMLDALAEHFPAQAEWTRPGGGLFIWATLPEYIDTSDLLARALRDSVAFVPGEGAFLDGRGRSSMRLNFSGADEDQIREGIRRIGEVIKEQVARDGTLTGEVAEAPPHHDAVADAAECDESAGARVVELPRRAERERRARRS